MFHATNPTLFGRPESVLSGSRALQSTASELRGATGAMSSSNTPETFFAALRLLGNFSGQLSGYFEATESAPYFNAIARECPSLEVRARGLERAHEHLKKSFARASALARGGEKICVAGLSAHIDHLLDGFEQHEDAEGALLQDFFLRAGEMAGSREVSGT
jgi:hypothetical protein